MLNLLHNPRISHAVKDWGIFAIESFKQEGSLYCQALAPNPKAQNPKAQNSKAQNPKGPGADTKILGHPQLLEGLGGSTWFREKPQVPLSVRKVSPVKVDSEGKNTG